MILTESLAATTVQTIPVLALALVLEYRLLIRRDMRNRKNGLQQRELFLAQLARARRELIEIGDPADWPEGADRGQIQARRESIAREVEEVFNDPRWRGPGYGLIWRTLGVLSYGLVAITNGFAMIISVISLAGGEIDARMAGPFVVAAFVASTILLVIAPFMATHLSWFSDIRRGAQSLNGLA
ncbi:hypothetical protein ACLQ2S_27085 [Micromonospora sp. DT48]|uniref:hypothetical protein n=1 Tax=Micromonospora sp. DT48 TaxID=3393429 RepID=UPI003CFA29F1